MTLSYSFNTGRSESKIALYLDNFVETGRCLHLTLACKNAWAVESMEANALVDLDGNDIVDIFHMIRLAAMFGRTR